MMPRLTNSAAVLKHARRRWRRRYWLGVTVSVVLLAVAASNASGRAEATADYTPSTAGYTYGVGAYAWVAEPSGTVLDISGAVATWNGWIGSTRLFAGSTSGCGSSISCIVFANDGTTVTINGTSCAVPQATSGAWATAYIEAGGYKNITCGIGTTTYPLFVVALDDERTFNATQKLHIVRHEMAHGMRLWDENHTCWTSGATYYPLLNNGTFGTCASYPNNTVATTGEINKAKSLNGW